MHNTVLNATERFAWKQLMSCCAMQMASQQQQKMCDVPECEAESSRPPGSQRGLWHPGSLLVLPEQEGLGDSPGRGEGLRRVAKVPVARWPRGG